jgi:predicted nucleic acid-binding protein
MAVDWAYFDTSALVKRYVREEGSKRARELLRRYRFLSCTIVSVEALSALKRRKVVGDLSERSYGAILSRMRADREHWELVEINDGVLSRAEEVIEKVDVRTLDALHIAAALAFRSLAGLRLPFVTGDDRQRLAAQQMGLEVLWIPSK